MKKQAISLLLLAAMLSVAACAEKTDDPVSSGDTSVNSVSESESESETRIEPVLPDERYDVIFSKISENERKIEIVKKNA